MELATAPRVAIEMEGVSGGAAIMMLPGVAAWIFGEDCRSWDVCPVFETSPRRAVIARRTIRCFKARTHASSARPADDPAFTFVQQVLQDVEFELGDRPGN